MAKATLHIGLSKSAFTAGEPLVGEVVVQANEATRCNGVTVARRWYAHGKGNTANGPWTKISILPGADWSAGMEYRYPFELGSDPAPVTYHGEYLNVDWVLQASADVPWALDPSAEVPFLVRAGEQPASWHVPAPPSGSKGDSGLGVAIFGGLFGGTFAAFGLFAIAASPTLAVGWIFTGVGALIAGAAVTGPIRRKIAEHSIGHPQVRIDPSTARRGTVVVANFRSRPPGTVTVSGATVQLVATERVVAGSGKNSHTHTRSRAIVEHKLESGQIATSPAIELEVPMTVPDDAHPSFSATDNRLDYRVRIEIRIEDGPAWEETFPILLQ